MAAALLSGCTTIIVHSEGKLTTENRFGIVRLDFADAPASAVAVSSIGIVALPGALSVGWTTWQGVRLAPGTEEACFSVHFAPPQHEE